MSRLPPRPDLDWTEDGAPRARACNDVYFSRAGGLEETRAVFLAGCGLPDGWRGRRAFTIGELGFGTGLNALATWAQWKATRSAGAVLHCISVEGFPLERDEAARALAPYAEIAPLAAKLLARWPVRARGAQRVWFPEDGFALTVIHAPAEAALAGFVGAIDAWFLDGFTPARNPQMWSEALMARIAALSAPGARLASYSVAGSVRRALTAAGFAVDKRPGFSGKRERLEARLVASPSPRASYYGLREADCASVAVIGAGIAGASVAAALTRRGVRAIVYDAAATVAAGASGNPVGLVSPRLDRTDTAVARLHRAAYLDALQNYRALGVFNACGVLARARDDADRAAQADLIADPPLPHTQMRAADGGLLHVTAGTVEPRRAVGAMLSGATLRLSMQVSALERVVDRWLLRDDDGNIVGEATAVVLANGARMATIAQTRWAPLEFTRGQLEWGNLAGEALTLGLESSAYVAPCNGGIAFGATFDRLDAPMAVCADEASRVRNLAALRALSPDIADRVTQLQSRAAVRAATQDRVPIAGVAPDAAAFAASHANLAHGILLDQSIPVHDGLYLLGGLGSRGLTLAPLLGERVAAEILGEPQALDRGALDAVHPARFLVRALKRRQPISA